jgi:hypothetical protein
MTFRVGKSPHFDTREQRVGSKHPSASQLFGMLKGSTDVRDSNEDSHLTPMSFCAGLAFPSRRGFVRYSTDGTAQPATRSFNHPVFGWVAQIYVDLPVEKGRIEIPKLCCVETFDLEVNHWTAHECLRSLVAAPNPNAAQFVLNGLNLQGLRRQCRSKIIGGACAGHEPLNEDRALRQSGLLGQDTPSGSACP